MANVAWNFWEANAGDEKERAKMDRDMYEPLAPLPFTDRVLSAHDGWTLAPWTPGEKGAVIRG